MYGAKALDASAPARLVFWLRILKDAVRNGLVERARRGDRPLPLGAHRVKGHSVMSLLAEDLRHAFRALKSQRGLTAVIVVTLALGIGANSAIFTVVNAVLLGRCHSTTRSALSWCAPSTRAAATAWCRFRTSTTCGAAFARSRVSA